MTVNGDITIDPDAVRAAAPRSGRVTKGIDDMLSVVVPGTDLR
ncbi:hypothetical protein [Micromonospora sp. NPDC047738]